MIYFCGLIFNIWNYTFLSGYTEKYYGFAIKYAPTPITYESIFMIKIILTTLFFILYSLLGVLVRKIVIFLSPKTIACTQTTIKNVKKKSINSIEGQLVGQKLGRSGLKNLNLLKLYFEYSTLW